MQSLHVFAQKRCVDKKDQEIILAEHTLPIFALTPSLTPKHLPATSRQGSEVPHVPNILMSRTFNIRNAATSISVSDNVLDVPAI